MQWVKASERLPVDGEEVLVRAGADFMLAVYDASTKTFVSKNGIPCNFGLERILWSSMYVSETDHRSMKTQGH